jgi:hypothetical protein
VIKPREFLRIAIIFMGALSFAMTVQTNTAWADGKHPHAEHDLAKASQNPVAKMISVPFENNATFNNGPEDGYVNTLNIKPVIPMSLTENWNLINRAIAPVIYQDERFPGEGSKFGMGDITYEGFISPAKPGKFIWGLGPAVVIPTGSGDRMSSDKWSAGPAAVGLTMPGHWVVGALAQNVWSFAGEGEADSVNAFLFQYFVNYNMKKGWYLSTAPVITANWQVDDSDDRWTVPFGGGLGRVFKMGKQHVNMKLAGYYSVEKPDNASDWNLQFSCTFLFPK